MREAGRRGRVMTERGRTGWRMALAVVLAAACADAGDIIYTPPPNPAVDLGGLFQLTVDPRPDYVRGFTATGDSIVFTAMRPGKFADDTTWTLYTVAATGGPEHPDAALYQGILNLPAMSLLSRADGRILAVWARGNNGLSIGPAGCPHCYNLAAWLLRFVRLKPTDGARLATLPSWTITAPAADVTDPAPETFTVHVRITPAEQEADKGMNPFGPVAPPTGPYAYYSDGDVVWRINLDDETIPRDSIALGAYPAVSHDGALLAFATPVGLDSTAGGCTYLHGLAFCTEFTMRYTYSGWATHVVRLSDGAEILTTPGAEPAFAGDDQHVVVRGDSLSLVSLADGSVVPIPRTDGAFSPAISPDGMYLAFSRVVDRNADVYFVKLH